MRDWTSIRERYTRDGVPVRLGGLATNLGRIDSFSHHPGHQEVVESLLEESKFFIEWVAPEAEVEVAAELVALQRQLARWHLHWADLWADPERRMAVAQQARDWSDRVLEMSGLLEG
jgi:hypothetical protein